MKKKQNDSLQQLNSNAGFSLVELLIAVIILAIIVVPMLYNFRADERKGQSGAAGDDGRTGYYGRAESL